MTQAARPSLVASTDDGITLSTKFNNATAALYTSHAGAAAPPSPEKGQTWVDTSGEGGTPSTHVLKMYDGSAFQTMGTLNRTTGAYAVAGNLPLVGGSMTGAILGAFGTAALPGYAFSGDPDVGMYRSAANELSFATAGVQRLALTTTALTATLASITLTNAGTTINLDKTSGASGVNQILFKSAGSARWGFNVSGAESTGDAGSTFFLQLFNDAGTLRTNYLQIQRATGYIGINGAFLANNQLVVRTNGAAATEDGLGLINANTGSDGGVRMSFMVSGTTPRAIIAGVREGASANGQLQFYTYLGATANAVMTLNSAKQAWFSGDVSVTGNFAASAAANFAGTITANGGINFGSSPWDFMYRFRYNSIGGIPATILNVNTADQGYIVGGTNIIQISLGSGVMNIADNVGGFWSVNLNPSDIRLKENLAAPAHNNGYWLEQINAIKLYAFDWKPDTMAGKGHVKLGLTTENLKAIDAAMVIDPQIEGGYESANLLAIVARLVAANQALTARVSALENAK